MFIHEVSYETAAEFVQAYENLDKEPIYVGETEFFPCLNDMKEDFYVMFGALGEAALIGVGVVPTLNS